MGKGPNRKNVIKYKPKTPTVFCKKQFPDCPSEPNEEFCKSCPLFVRKPVKKTENEEINEVEAEKPQELGQ